MRRWRRRATCPATNTSRATSSSASKRPPPPLSLPCCAVVIVTVALRTILPPAPTQVRVKVVSTVSAAEVSVPDWALLPAHPPDAVQLVALPAVHVSTVVPPLVTDVGAAEKVNVGAGGVVDTSNPHVEYLAVDAGRASRL